jgi:hypothetical protein
MPGSAPEPASPMRCSAPMFEAKIDEPIRNQPAPRLARK